MTKLKQTLWLLLCASMLTIWLVKTLVTLYRIWKG